jgi:hypothetical protein
MWCCRSSRRGREGGKASAVQPAIHARSSVNTIGMVGAASTVCTAVIPAISGALPPPWNTDVKPGPSIRSRGGRAQAARLMSSRIVWAAQTNSNAPSVVVTAADSSE